MRLHRICCVLLLAMDVSAIAAQSSHKAPVAVIDTSLGRIRCQLFEAERPKTTAQFIALAQGTKAHEKPFYDGTPLYGIPAGVRGGSRSDWPAASLPVENEPVLRYDRPGRMGMRRRAGQTGTTEFMILDHANSEDDGDDAVVFGQCDDASLPVVTEISHRLAVADNHPDRLIVIHHIAILREGQPLPPVARDLPPAMLVANPRAPIASAPEPAGPLAVIETTMGQLSCRLFTKESPVATSVFIGLADGTKEWTNPVTKKVEHGTRFYDGMGFDRVIPDFVIQTGDYTGDISGATDIGFRFKNETFPGLSYDRPGRLAFGNNGPDTNNSEIFISEHPMRRLDGGFTIIGQCDDASVRLVEAIARVPRDAANKPIKPVKIIQVRFVSQ
ncbi:peptidylprolyl isomerase [Granulicella aggregans]|uniref:peptidylprolyl isomerase n=1 Tax=Granulicella aggregans TaxID=474949 RepID=UPI0021E0711F|nr:peptidylprolyl isomerase [Granulicella aggregans]